MIDTFLKYMKNQSWNIELKSKQEYHLPKTIQDRYTNIPEQWLEFISTVKSVVSSDDTTWFLCEDDYDIQGDKAFQWNEWELISLESAEDDTKWKAEITDFWNNYLPIIMSVQGGYSYYAVSMKDNAIVHGAEPEFEECEVVADSFTDFMEKIVNRELLFKKC